MYKILTKMHTQRDGIYQTYMILGQDKQMVEYATEDKEEAKQMALTLLKTVGYKDLRIVDDQDYYIDIINIQNNLISQEDEQDAEKLLGHIGYGDLYLSNNAQYDIDLIWGQKPMPEQTKYTIDVQGPDELLNQPIEYTVSNDEVELRVPLFFDKRVKVFHLIINEELMNKGIPAWIQYQHVSDTEGVLILKNIDRDYNIQIEVDAWAGEINTAGLTPEQIQAINEMSIMLNDDLSFVYDNEALSVDFQLKNGNLIVISKVEGMNFTINKNKELEVAYNNGNNN